MKSGLLFSLLAVSIPATAVLLLFLPHDRMWWAYVALGVSFLLLLMLWRSVIMPAAVARRGMELISSQDFNNRLISVGEHNADNVVALFNSLIDKLRGERLRNIEQEGFLRSLIEASPMGVMILDFDGKVNLINDSMLRITGIADGDAAKGQRIASLPTDMASKMAEVPLGKNVIIRRGDVRRYRCWHLSFVQTGFQRHFYLLESLTEEMMKAEREAYEKVIRIISHEVNNTMGGVKSVLELLHDSVDEQDVKEVVESCDDRCEMLCSFIRAYADVVKVPEPVCRRVDLDKELTAMLPFLRGMAGSDISIDVDFEDSRLVADIDLSLIQQVVVNIVKNAAESISGKGFIHIAGGRKGGNVWMEISNDGAPISEEVSQKLFSPFFSTKKEGRGLGLTLTGEILRRHSASFSLQTGSDRITRFYIEFP